MAKVTTKKSRIWKGVLLFWTLFIGFGAVAGGIGMLSDPSGKALGMDGMLPYFQVLPFAEVLFRDLFFSGIALLIVNGLTNLCASVFLILKKKIGVILGTLFGITLMAWICIQFYMFPLNFMSTIYFVFGFLQMLSGIFAYVYGKQEEFSFQVKDYPHVGSRPQEIVVYFSREGYTKKIAYTEAERTGAEVYEIKATEKTEGISGFWWCGRFGMHRWGMPVEKATVDFSQYEKVTLCTPVWVFAMSSPMREFCKSIGGKVRNAELISVHCTKGKYDSVRKECENLLQTKIENYQSICCPFGKVKKNEKKN